MNENTKSILNEHRDNGPFRAFLESPEIKEGDTVSFKCKKCGECCRETETLITPPEYARILWFMFRTGMPLQDIGAVFMGGESGAPLMRLKRQTSDGISCAFLSPILRMSSKGKLEESGKNVCEIWPVRPAVCRTYPFGRLRSLPAAAKLGIQPGVTYCIQKRCPGFDTTEDAETQREAKTVGEYVNKNLDPEMEEERLLYLTRVQPAWKRINARRKSPDYPRLHTINNIEKEEGQVFFGTPRPPEDTAQDHETILRWMKMIEAIPAIFEFGSRKLREIMNSQGRMPTVEEQGQVDCIVMTSIQRVLETGEIPEYVTRDSTETTRQS